MRGKGMNDLMREKWKKVEKGRREEGGERGGKRRKREGEKMTQNHDHHQEPFIIIMKNFFESIKILSPSFSLSLSLVFLIFFS